MNSILTFLYDLTGNWYIIAFLFALFIQIITFYLKAVSEKELIKRKEILSELEKIKEESTDVEKAKAVVKKHNGKPVLILLPVFFTIISLTTIFFLFSSVNSVAFNYLVPVLTFILTLLNTFTRKTWVFSLVVSLIALVVYLRIEPIFVVFLMNYHGISLAEKLMKKVKEEKEKKNK